MLALTKREVVARYRDSVMGITWSFLNPILMVLVYTFVFSVEFKARWGSGGEESKADFALILFVGMIIHGLFAECLNRAPGLILSNVNYVKKVIAVLLLAQLMLNQQLMWTVLLFPCVLLPRVFATSGFAWFFAGLGVNVRDIGQITGMVTTVLLLLSPVFYPISALPEQYHIWLHLNPLTFIIEEGRNTLIFGKVLDIGTWGMMLAAGMLISWAGFVWFQKIRRGFAGVL